MARDGSCVRGKCGRKELWDDVVHPVVIRQHIVCMLDVRVRVRAWTWAQSDAESPGRAADLG